MHCSNPSDFELKVRGIASTSDSRWDNFEKTDGTDGADDRAAASISSASEESTQSRRAFAEGSASVRLARRRVSALRL